MGTSKKIFCYLLLIVVAISYMDVFNPTGALQSSLSTLYEAMTIVLFVVSFRISALQNKFIRRYLYLLGLAVVAAISIDGLFCVNAYLPEVMDVAISMACIYIGYNLKLNNKDLRYIYLLYGIALLLTALTLIINNIGGFVITDNYKIDSKNGIGAMLAVLSVSMFAYLGCSDCSKLWKLISVGVIVFSLVAILTMRARASTMTVAISAFLYVIQLLRNGNITFKQLFRWFVVVVFLIVVILFVVEADFSVISEYVYNSLFQNVEDDVTTGRMERNVVAWDFFLSHPLFGRLDTPQDMLWVHNYLLRIVTDYGVIGGLSLMLLYLFLLIHVINVHWKYKTSSSLDYIGYWAVLPILLLSVVEPLFPYSPGTAVLFAYLLLGYSMRRLSRS